MPSTPTNRSASGAAHAAAALTLEQINHASVEAASALLEGVYEHSPWIAQAALAQRPFHSLAQLKHALAQVVHDSGEAAQLALLRAHPELAGKAMVDHSLTAESAHEQDSAGLTRCTPEEFALIQSQNAAYSEKFGFPFILAVRGPRGTGLGKATILATLQRRLQHSRAFELAEALRQVHRIAEIRLADKFGQHPVLGQQVWDWQEALARHSEAPEVLTVTYLSAAHRACAQHIRQDMLAAGCDSAHIDAVGNVVGVYRGDGRCAQALLTGSHYDTVRNAGKYDGRLGIYVPLACVQQLQRQGLRLPYDLEIVAFAEEEGQRFKATFLGSGALVGAFDPAWLDLQDADGVLLRTLMQDAGCDPQAIPSLRRDAARYLGFVEVHIEQGPVLNALNLPLGIVTSINATVRYAGEMTGRASHAGTTPMDQRQDAACAVAELMLYVEQRARADGDSVGTVGMLQVPNGSINVVPGRCLFSLDLRAPSDAQRDALERDVLAQLEQIATARGVQHSLTRTLRASAAPSAPAWQQRWEAAVAALGLPLQRMPSGAGHDAMKLHELLPQAMLFVRGENAGISHNPLESTTCDDMQLAVDAFDQLLAKLAHDTVA